MLVRQRKIQDSKIKIMTNKQYWIIGIIILALAVAYFLYPDKKADGQFDEFALCLAEKGITMYGADWCPHCQEEKVAFGNSFRLVPYVECPNEPQKCLAAGIDGYPTWIFPDGKRLEDRQGIEKISEESDCPLRQSESEASPLSQGQ